MTVTASLVDEPSRTYDLTTIITPDQVASSATSAAVVTVIRDEPPDAPSPDTDYPTTYLIYPDGRWVATTTPGVRQQVFSDFADPSQTFSVRLGFTEQDFDDGRWRLADDYSLTAGLDFVGEATVFVHRMITLDLSVVDTSGAPVSDASMTVSSPSMATTALTPADAVAAGRFELTADSGGTPLKWGSYTASVSAPGKLARTVTFDAPSGYPTDLVHEETIVLEDRPVGLTAMTFRVDDGHGVEVGEYELVVQSPTLGTVTGTADADGYVTVDLMEDEEITYTISSNRGFLDFNDSYTPQGETDEEQVSLAIPSGTKIAHLSSSYTVSHFTVRAGNGSWDSDLVLQPSSLDRVSVAVDNSSSTWIFRSWCTSVLVLKERTLYYSYMATPQGVVLDAWGGC